LQKRGSPAGGTIKAWAVLILLGGAWLKTFQMEKIMRATVASLRLPPASRVAPPERRRVKPDVRISWLRRWFARREPTAYQRCLAVHIHYASPRSALS
jgi:hypothetical protein